MVLEQKVDSLVKLIRAIDRKLTKFEVQEKEYLSEQDVMSLTGKSKRVLAMLRKRGYLCYTSINGRTPRYEKESVYKLIELNSSRQ